MEKNHLNQLFLRTVIELLVVEEKKMELKSEHSHNCSLHTNRIENTSVETLNKLYGEINSTSMNSKLNEKF